MVGFRALFTEDRKAPSSHPKKLRGLLPLLMEATGHQLIVSKGASGICPRCPPIARSRLQDLQLPA